MAAIVWPPTLAQVPLVESYQETEPVLTIRSAVDAGPPKVRRRFTAGIPTITAQYMLTRTQTQILSDFYVGPAAGGATIFEWPDPRQGVAVRVRFRQPPRYDPEAAPPDGPRWRTTIELEKLPPGVLPTP